MSCSSDVRNGEGPGQQIGLVELEGAWAAGREGVRLCPSCRYVIAGAQEECPNCASLEELERELESLYAQHDFHAMNLQALTREAAHYEEASGTLAYGVVRVMAAAGYDIDQMNLEDGAGVPRDEEIIERIKRLVQW